MTKEEKIEMGRNTQRVLMDTWSWTQSSFSGLPPAQRTEYRNYIQAVSALTDNDFINDMAFPQLPDAVVPVPVSAEALSRELSARNMAKAIPNWATWTQAEWQTYFDANLSDTEVDKVTTIAQARIALKRQNFVILNLTKLVLALRDQAFPDL